MVKVDQKTQVLEQLKLLIGGDLEEELPLLNLFIDMAIEEIEDYCGAGVTIPTSLITQMANIKYQRRGTEALSNTNYSGNGEVYLNDYPASILRRMDDLKDSSKRRLRTL